MPSKKNPKNITVGPGLAGAGSVSISSLVLNTQGNPNVRASEVSNETPLGLSGANVQEHINQAALRAQAPLPNTVGTSTSPNDGKVDTTPASVAGFSQGAVAEYLYASTSVTIEGVMFPADRGILVIEAQGVPVAALDLEAVFIEGDPEDTAIPTRALGQNDYVAGTIANGTVTALPQISLRDRVPVQTVYAGPLTYDGYSQDFPAQQIATFSVDVAQADLTRVAYEVIHYRSITDFLAGSMLGRKYGSDIVGGGATIYVDANPAVPSPQSFSFDAANPVSAGTKVVSGVSVYDAAVDVMNTNLTVNAMFDNSFLNTGIKIRQQANAVVNEAALSYTQYDGGNPSPGQVASFSGQIAFPNLKSVEIDPELEALGPYGASATLTSSTASVILLHGEPLETPGAVSTTRTTTETFSDEATRYPGDQILMEPNGQGTSWNPSTSLLVSTGQAQVRPARVGAPLALVEGGELGYPQDNYSLNYKPTGNPDYSGITGPVSYYRAFDLGSPRKTGRLRFVGKNVAVNLFEDMRFSTVGADNTAALNYGHPDGIRVELSTVVNGQGTPNHDLGKPFGLGGAFISVEIVSPNEVIVDFQVPQAAPLSPQGFYPLAMSITFSGSVASKAIALYKIELLPAI